MKAWTLTLAISTDNPHELADFLRAIEALAEKSGVTVEMPKDTYRKLGQVKHMVAAEPAALAANLPALGFDTPEQLREFVKTVKALSAQPAPPVPGYVSRLARRVWSRLRTLSS